MSHPADIHTGVTTAEADELARLATGRNVLECGSWYGFSTVVMGRVARRVVAVDWHHGDRHAGQAETLGPFTANLKRYGVAERVDVRVGRFEDVLPGLRGVPFDVAFLDGMHDRESVERDLPLVAPHVARRGAFLALHDYTVPPDWGFEVKPVVDEWLAERPEWERVNEVDKLLVLRHR